VHITLYPTYMSATSSKYSLLTIRSTRIIGPHSVTYNNLKSSELQYRNVGKFLSLCKVSYIRRVYLQTPPLETKISLFYIHHNYRLKLRQKIATKCDIISTYSIYSSPTWLFPPGVAVGDGWSRIGPIQGVRGPLRLAPC